MNGSEEHIDELIEQYLLDKMSPEDLTNFKKEIEINPELSKRLDEHRILRDAIQSESDVLDFRNTVASVVKENQSSSSYRTYWRVAAVLVIAISSIMVFYQFNPSQTPSELSIAYFEPFPDLVTSRDEMDSLVSIAMTAYNDEDFEEAIPVLEYLVSSEETLLELYLGVSYFASKEYEKSLDLWSKLEVDNDPSLIYTVQWYKALTLLSLNQTEKAKQILQELVAGQSSVQAKAEELLGKL